jgi:cellulose synthase/poly-beta-1,6-N-acetylglucosamine synthase-like glycosyltransferase
MTNRERVQAAIYAGLFVVLAASALLFASRYGGDVRIWEEFTYCYLLLLVVYTWYLFTLLLVHDVHPRRYHAYAGEKIAVLIPCFNESPELVEQSIRTVLAAEGRKQVVVIDDGSTNGVQERLAQLAEELPIHVHYFPENRGKREGPVHGPEHELGHPPGHGAGISSPHRRIRLLTRIRFRRLSRRH